MFFSNQNRLIWYFPGRPNKFESFRCARPAPFQNAPAKTLENQPSAFSHQPSALSDGEPSIPASAGKELKAES
jgi:hypothetical protein